MLLLLLLTVTAALAASSGGVVGHQQWTTRQGLPLNGVSGLNRDADGYLLVATFDGLVRFDGVRFTPVQPADGGRWPGRRIQRVEVTPDGAIWARHVSRKVSRLDPDGGLQSWAADALAVGPDGSVVLGVEGGLRRYHQGELTAVAASALSGRSARLFLVTEDGVLWCVAGRQLLRVDEDGASRSFPLRVEEWGEVVGLTPAAGGGVWLNAAHALVRADGQSLAPLMHGEEAWRPDNALWVNELGDGDLWITTEVGLFRWRSGQVQGPFAGEVGRPPWGEAVHLDARGRRWVATHRSVSVDGVQVFEVEAGARIDTVLRDPHGNLWLGTDRSGLHMLQEGPLGVIGLADGLPSDNVYALAEDNEGLWIGLKRGGLVRHSERGVEAFWRAEGLPDDIYALLRSSDGVLWVGAGDEGLFRRAGAGFVREPGVPARTVYALHQRPDGQLWAATAAGLWALVDGEWRDLSAELDLPDAPIRALAEGKEGVWAGTQGAGLLHITPQGTRRWDQDSGLGSALVRSLLLTPRGLWVGTEDRGMVFLDAAGGVVAELGSDQGLPDDVIHALLRDGQGGVWGSSNRGLFRVDEVQLQALEQGDALELPVRVFTERDGMPDREGNGGYGHAALRRADGVLAFSTQRGVVLADPGAAGISDAATAAVQIEAVRAGDRTWRGDAPIRLGPAQRSVEMQYTQPLFRGADALRFELRMDGLETDWVPVGERRVARYPELPPGQYRFRVRALGGTQEAAVDLQVIPLFTETQSFKALIGLGLALLGVAVGALRVAGLRRRERELTALVAQRTEALRQETVRLEEARLVVQEQASRLQQIDRLKTRYFANLSHELRTPLTLVLGPLEDALQGRLGDLPQPARRPLGLAQRSAHRLLELVNQLLDVIRIDAGQLRLELEVCDFAALVTACVDQLVPLAERRGQSLQLSGAQAPVPVALDRREASKIVLNLVTNAVKFTPPGGRVTVDLTLHEDRVHLRVTDSGPGVPRHLREQIFQRFFMGDVVPGQVQPGTGLGLALARELAEAHGGVLRLLEHEEAGASFQVELPLAEGPSTEERAEPDWQVQLPGLALPAPPAAPTSADPQDTAVVLLVEDDEAVRDWIAGLLEPRYRVLQAAEGAQALALARELTPDLIVTDRMMPGLDGMGLVRALRADPELSWLPVVMLTARGSAQARVEGLEHGADLYMSKPFSSQVLLAQLHSLLQLRTRLRRRFEDRAPVAPEPALLSADDRYMQKVRDAVAQGAPDPGFGVEQLAAAVAQSRTQLYRRVKALLGTTPSALLSSHRLQLAERLLQARVGNVSEVAYASGFNSVAYFSTCFRKRTGQSPTAWLKAQGAASGD